MELCLEHLTAQERELSISVDTLAQTEQALKRLDSLESNAQVSVSQSDRRCLQITALIYLLCVDPSVSKIMDSFLFACLCRLYQEVMSRAQIIILHGHQLSAGHHYAMALIMQRCNELRHYCDTLNAALKTKHTRLLQTHQLLLCLGQVVRRMRLHTHTCQNIFMVIQTCSPPSGPNLV